MLCLHALRRLLGIKVCFFLFSILNRNWNQECNETGTCANASHYLMVSGFCDYVETKENLKPRLPEYSFSLPHLMNVSITRSLSSPICLGVCLTQPCLKLLEKKVYEHKWFSYKYCQHKSRKKKNALSFNKYIFINSHKKVLLLVLLILHSLIKTYVFKLIRQL